MTKRIQVDNKQYSVRIKNYPDGTVGVSIWRQRTLRCGTFFNIVTPIDTTAAVTWAKDYIKKNKDKHFAK